MTVTEVKTRILSLIDEIDTGDEIEITRHGRTVARLVPARGAPALRARFAGVAMTAADDEGVFSTGATWDLP